MIVILFVVGTLFSIISLKYFYFPYIWIPVYWLICFGFLTLVSKKAVQKSIWFNLAFFIFILGALEGYSYFSLKNTADDRRLKVVYTHGYFTSNEILGYAPTKGKTATAKKYFGQQLIYDVTYTINDFGLRVSSSSEPLHNHQCVLFFGGSFTFGAGVEDYETMPYIVQKLSKYQVYNFGFHGYGPHQMLSAIENGMVACKPKMVIYQAICDHVARSAGHSSWDKHGPKYILQNGRLKYDGHFDDHEGVGYFIKKEIVVQLNKSNFYRKFFNKDRYTITDQDIQIFLEIVDTSRSKLVEEYPKVEFYVILWDKSPENATYQKVRDGLKTRSIKFHLVSDMLPGFSENKAKYEISPHEKHSNPLANQLIAEYVVKNIIGMENPRTSE